MSKRGDEDSLNKDSDDDRKPAGFDPESMAPLDVDDFDWDAMVRGLVAFKEKNNHLMVPYKCIDNPDLGKWGKLYPCVGSLVR